MAKHLYGYGLALLCLVVATISRVAFIPAIGYGLIYGLLMICVWVSGRFGGFGPSVFALLVGAFLLILLRYLDPTYGWSNLEFQVGLLFYLAVGVAVILLCRSEHIARSLLLQQLAEHRVTEDTAQANASRFQAVMQNTSAVIYIKDLQGRFLMVNKRFEDLSSHSPVVGKTDADLFQSEIVTMIQAHDQKIRDTGKPLEFEETVPLRDGLHTYVAVKFPIFDSAGQVVAVGGISTDITERKRAQDALQAEQEMLRHTIEVQDRERQLIAYEIHDGLIQYVTGALMQLEALQAHGVRYARFG